MENGGEIHPETQIGFETLLESPGSRSTRAARDETRRQLQEELENKVTIPYATVWKGRERASNNIFGHWNDCFDWLYRFKAEVEMRCPSSVVEIGTKVHEDQIYFSQFFCAFQPCIQGGKEAAQSVSSPFLKLTGHFINITH